MRPVSQLDHSVVVLVVVLVAGLVVAVSVDGAGAVLCVVALPGTTFRAFGYRGWFLFLRRVLCAGTCLCLVAYLSSCFNCAGPSRFFPKARCCEAMALGTSGIAKGSGQICFQALLFLWGRSVLGFQKVPEKSRRFKFSTVLWGRCIVS